MPRITRKFNPGFLDDRELVESFCVRNPELESVLELLRESTGPSNPPQLVIGPRGSGKTFLLLRAAAELRRDPALSAAFLPVVFGEESYEVSTAGEFWLECLSQLADQASSGSGDSDLRATRDSLRSLTDDRALEERCLGALLDLADRHGRRLVLFVENMNMMFRDMMDPDAGWRLRKVLQTEPRIVLVASATSRFDDMDHPDHALYDLFRVCTLRPLDTDECAVLWQAVSGRDVEPRTLRSLEILTGGSPRLLAIVARFGSARSFRRLLADLLELVDDHTEYFKSHIESLPPQERRIYLALADLWKPATTREIADRARLDTSKCSAQLTRLVERGVVRNEGGTARRKQYYLTERLYNIYYLLRRRRGPAPLVEALIHFMEAYYSPDELLAVGSQIAHDAENLSSEMHSLHRAAFERLACLPALAAHRQDLCAGVPEQFARLVDRGTEVPPSAALADSLKRPHGNGQIGAEGGENVQLETLSQAMLASAESGAEGGFEDAIAAYEAALVRFGVSEKRELLEPMAEAFVNRAVTLGDMGRHDESVAVCDEVVRRFGGSESQDLLESVGVALLNKAVALAEMDRPHEAGEARQEVVRRFSGVTHVSLLELVASALLRQAFAFDREGRTEDALRICDEIADRFGQRDEVSLLEPVATALVHKGTALCESGRQEEAVAVLDEAINRFGSSETDNLVEEAVHGLFHKAIALRELDRTEEALSALEEIERRFLEGGRLRIEGSYVSAMDYKTQVLYSLNRLEDAVITTDAIVDRFDKSADPSLQEYVARALFRRGDALRRLNRITDMSAAWDQLVHRFGHSENPRLLENLAHALLHKALAFAELGRSQDALAVWSDIENRFRKRESRKLRVWAEMAATDRGSFELRRKRYDVAIETVEWLLHDSAVTSAKYRWRGHQIRASARLARGELSDCEHDIIAMLTILPRVDSIMGEAVRSLMEFSISVGASRILDLISESPARELLLPLTTALQHELGRKPRVPLEVEEIASDIRRDLAEMRTRRANSAPESGVA